MKAKVFLVHNQKGYQCEVFFSEAALKDRVLTMVHSHAEASGHGAFLKRLPELENDPEKLANEYGMFVRGKKDQIALTVLDADVADPESFQMIS